jgi:hypothetical protein
MKNRFLIFILLCPCLSLWAADFGLILNQSAGYGGIGKDGLKEDFIMEVPKGYSLSETFKVRNF